MEEKTKEKQNFYNLFVYGTLQQGQSRNFILQGLKFEKATLPNHRKLEPPSLGFPFIVRNDSNNVHGEVYFDISQSLINELDRIEGEGYLYHRIMVKVITDNGKEVEAFTYYPSEKLIKNYI